MMKRFLSGALGVCLAIVAVDSQAAITYSVAGSTILQDFNSLPTTAVLTNGPAVGWANNSTLSGWSLFDRNGAAVPTIIPGNGGSNSGSFYSFGAPSSTERSLGGTGSGGSYFGSPAAGTLAGHIAFAATNSTGLTLTNINISFDGEQWRNGGNASPQTMVLEYGFGNTFASVAAWTAPGSTFNFTSPVVSASSAAVNGNVEGLVSGLGGTLSNLSWADGESVWIRWIELNDIGNDHGLAIDNFGFSATATATAIPEPSSLALLAICGVGGAIYRRRRGLGKTTASDDSELSLA